MNNLDHSDSTSQTRSSAQSNCISEKMSIVTSNSLPQWQMPANDTPVIPHEKSNIRLPSISELMASFANEESIPRNVNNNNTNPSYYSSIKQQPLTPNDASPPPYYGSQLPPQQQPQQPQQQPQPQQQSQLQPPQFISHQSAYSTIPLSPPLTANNDSTPSYSTSSSISSVSSSGSSSSIQMLLDASTSSDNMFHKKRSHSVSSASSNTSTTNNNSNTSNSNPSMSPPPFSASPYSPPLKRRGNLPRAVTDILRNWLSSHLHYPYPTEQEKIELMKQTGLSLNQVSNWFINARRRRVPAIYKHSGMMNVSDRPRRAVSDGSNLPRNIPSTLAHPRSIPQLQQQQQQQQPPPPPPPPSNHIHYSARQTHVPPQWKP